MGLCVEVGSDGVPFVQLGEHILRLDLEDLDESYNERSRIELRETPQIVEDALEKLRSLIKDEEGLNVPAEDDSFLIKFLRPCKFYPESTFKLMKRYYKFKLKHPELSWDLMPVKVKHVFEEELISFHPVRCDKGTRLMIITIAKWNTKTVSLYDMFRTIIMALEIAMIEPKTQVAGVHVLLNMQGLTLNQIFQFSPSFAKTTLDFIQQCIPVRLKGIHIVNQPYIFGMLYAIFKPFIGEKLRKRLFFYGKERKSLHARVSKESLPPSYDGTLDIPDCPGHLLAEMLCRYDKEFELCNTIGYTKEKVLEDDELISTT